MLTKNVKKSNINLYEVLVRKDFMKKTAIFIVLALVLASILFFLVYKSNHSFPIRDFDSLSLDNINKVMFVAHPDDEMLWGGEALIKDDYLVVCITCGVDKERVQEFKRVMKETGDEYLMLGYPDKTNGERDDWSSVREEITKDIEKILALKDWELVVTHNPFGEYGHIHHKMTSEIVTEVMINMENLYYFGTYYSKKNIETVIDTMPSLPEEIVKQKIEILKLYKTQAFIMTTFDHMFEHENWISYTDWEEGVR